MQYVPPLGATDPNASYVEGNPAAGIRGSFPTAAAIEDPMREVCNAIIALGLSPNPNDLTQLGQAIRISGRVLWCVDATVSAGTILLQGQPTLDAYRPGTVFIWISNTAPTGACTINVDNKGSLALTRADTTAIETGDILASRLTMATYDGTAVRLNAQIPVAEASLVHRGDDTSGAANVITVTNLSPAITAYEKGAQYNIKLGNNITGATTANFGPGEISVTRADGSPLQANDGLAGFELPMICDGTNLQIAGLNPIHIPQGVYYDLDTPGTTEITLGPGIYFWEAWGAGGGGGGCSGSAGTGSGGGGGEKRAGPFVLTTTTTIACTVGAPGAAGTTAPTVGGNGGSTSIGSYMTAVGGGGGQAGIGGVAPTGGTGGTGGSGGATAIPGQSGGIGYYIGSNPVSGQGSPSGDGGSPTLINITTADGATPGSFPGGGGSGASGSGGVAAAGASGRIRISSV